MHACCNDTWRTRPPADNGESLFNPHELGRHRIRDWPRFAFHRRQPQSVLIQLDRKPGEVLVSSTSLHYSAGPSPFTCTAVSNDETRVAAVIGQGSARITAASVSVNVSPPNAARPVSISKSTQPNAQMSAR